MWECEFQATLSYMVRPCIRDRGGRKGRVRREKERRGRKKKGNKKEKESFSVLTFGEEQLEVEPLDIIENVTAEIQGEGEIPPESKT